MSIRYIVKQEGLAVDLILWAIHGRRGQDLIGQCLFDNQGLAELGPLLPVGVSFLIPDLPAAAFISPAVSLYD